MVVTLKHTLSSFSSFHPRKVIMKDIESFKEGEQFRTHDFQQHLYKVGPTQYLTYLMFCFVHDNNPPFVNSFPFFAATHRVLLPRTLATVKR
jgi:hypothetical protein